MNLRASMSRLQEVLTYTPLSTDEIMDITYHSIHITWKNKMIEQVFKYLDPIVKEMNTFIETRKEILELNEDKKKSQRKRPKRRNPTTGNKMTPTPVL